jgi:predicted neuraminidase
MNKMNHLKFLLLLVISANINAQNPFSVASAVVKSEFIYKPEDVTFPSCHASTIVETSNGLIAAWFGGTDEKNPDVGIWISRFENGKWNIPVEVANGIQSKDLRYPTWNPVLFKKDNGEIVLYYKVGPDPRSWWGMFKTSFDNGKTWSSENKIPDNLLGPIKNKPVRLPDGKILYPTSFETPEKWNIYLETSDQDLKNWQKISIDNGNLNSIQPSVLFHKDGTLQLLCRSRNKTINTTWSKDNGKTWSSLTQTELPNNNAGTDAVTLSDGRQLLVFSPITKGRYKLGVAVSDDGINWNAAVLLENDSDKESEYSYPAVIQTKDGLVHITYTWKRELIKHVIIDPAKLKTKPIVNGEWPSM